MYAPSPVYPLQCGKCGGIFLWGEQGYVSGFPKTLAPPRPAVAGRVNPLPPVADFGMKEVRTKKKKHMTVDEKGNIKKSTLSGVDYICEKEMMIECSILYNLKRYTFRRNEMIIFGDESLKKVHEDLKAFLEKHSSKDKEESKK